MNVYAVSDPDQAQPIPPILYPGNTDRSFWTPTIPLLACWLVCQGYDAEPGRSHTEYARLWFCGSLVVCYNSGTALVQGQPDHALATLAALLRPAHQQRGAA